MPRKQQPVSTERTDNQKADAALRALKVLYNLKVISDTEKDNIVSSINSKYTNSKVFIKSSTKEFCPIRVFKTMMYRCYNPSAKSYKNYGGRGIKICDEWLNDKNLFNDWCVSKGWKKGLQVDRIEVNGDYTPTNCRLVNNKTNSRNTRKTIYAVFDGKRKPFIEWCEILKLKYTVIYADMRRNKISASDAIKKGALKNNMPMDKVK